MHAADSALWSHPADGACPRIGANGPHAFALNSPQVTFTVRNMTIECDAAAEPSAGASAGGARGAQAPAGAAESGAVAEGDRELTVTVDLAPGASRLVVLRQARARLLLLPCHGSIRSFCRCCIEKISVGAELSYLPFPSVHDRLRRGDSLHGRQSPT